MLDSSFTRSKDYFSEPQILRLVDELPKQAMPTLRCMSEKGVLAVIEQWNIEPMQLGHFGNVLSDLDLALPRQQW